MIQQFYVHRFGAGADAPGDGDVLRAGSGVAGRGVVGDDDGGAVFADGGAQHLGYAHSGGVYAALVHGLLGEHLVLSVEQQHVEFLLLEAGQRRPELVDHVLGAAYGPSHYRLGVGHPAAKLHGCEKLIGLCLADALELAEPAESHVGQGADAADLRQKVLGQRDDVLALDSGAEQYGHQLGVAQVPGADLPEPLARPLILGKVYDACMIRYRGLHCDHTTASDSFAARVPRDCFVQYRAL